jgi:hypothetical protein
VLTSIMVIAVVVEVVIVISSLQRAAAPPTVTLFVLLLIVHLVSAHVGSKNSVAFALAVAYAVVGFAAPLVVLRHSLGGSLATGRRIVAAVEAGAGNVVRTRERPRGRRRRHRRRSSSRRRQQRPKDRGTFLVRRRFIVFCGRKSFCCRRFLLRALPTFVIIVTFIITEVPLFAVFRQVILQINHLDLEIVVVEIVIFIVFLPVAISLRASLPLSTLGNHCHLSGRRALCRRSPLPR